MTILEQWTIVLQISLLFLRPVTCSSNITCSGGVATIGGPATVTCNFNRDIRNSTFVIRKFPINTIDFNTISRKDVLSCNWVKGPSDCETAPGYQFNSDTVTTTASVYILNATEDQEGIYECQLQTQEVIPIFTCNLTVEATEGKDAISDIDNFIISDLTPLGAFILLIVLIAIDIFQMAYFCYKHTYGRKPSVPVVRTADRGMNTPVLEVVDIGVDTETDGFAAFASKNPLVRLFKKDDKKTPPKQSTPKHSEENLAEEKGEKEPLLAATAPPQYVPPTQVKDPKADHSPDDGQPPQEAVGGADVAQAGDFVTLEIPIDIDDPVDPDQDTALNENGKSKGKDKKRSRFSLSKK